MSKKKEMADQSKSAPDTNIAELSFEEAIANLEKMIERIESGETGLEESLTEYERGIALYRHCRDILNKAEQRFEKLRFDDHETDVD